MHFGPIVNAFWKSTSIQNWSNMYHRSRSASECVFWSIFVNFSLKQSRSRTLKILKKPMVFQWFCIFGSSQLMFFWYPILASLWVHFGIKISLKSDSEPIKNRRPLRDWFRDRFFTDFGTLWVDSRTIIGDKINPKSIQNRPWRRMCSQDALHMPFITLLGPFWDRWISILVPEMAPKF